MRLVEHRSFFVNIEQNFPIEHCWVPPYSRPARLKLCLSCYAAQAGAQAFIQQKAPFPFHGKGAFETVLLVVDFCHVSDEHQNLVAVAPLIVIPGNELDELVGQSDTAFASKMEVCGSVKKSEETTASSV